MTNRDRFNKITDFLIQSLSVIVFLLSIGILFVVMFVTLPEDVDWRDMIKQPENYSLIIITIILNIQVKFLGNSLVTHNYHQSNEYQFAEKLDGKTTSELLKNQSRFIQFNANRTIKNREAAQYEYLSNYGYQNIEQVRADVSAIKPTRRALRIARKANKYGRETFELADQYKKYKLAPKVLKKFKKVKYISTIIHPNFWNYITQSSFKKGKRILTSYKPAGRTGTVVQTILMSLVTSVLAIQTFKFGYDPTKFPVFIAMLSTIGVNFLVAIILSLVRLKEIPAFVKNKFRELNAFRVAEGLPEAPYLEEAAKDLANQIAEELKANKERARLKKERKAAKMTEDSKVTLAKEANKRIELEIRRQEAINKREELHLAKKENQAVKLMATAIKKESN